eukprot:1590773-Lingulodinium_polyedra.AAC.1
MNAANIFAENCDYRAANTSARQSATPSALPQTRPSQKSCPTVSAKQHGSPKPTGWRRSLTGARNSDARV